MARVTARQAFTRAKNKRTASKSANDKAILEARRRYIRQLSNIGIQVEGASQGTVQQQFPMPARKQNATKRRSPPRRASQASQSKKITDYFMVTRNLELIPRVSKSPVVTSSRDANGIEVITIDDSEACDSNNNHDNIENNHSNISLESLNSSAWNTSSDSSNCDSFNKIVPLRQTIDVKPLNCKLDLSSLGTSFGELNLKVHIDEDIEIVDMLPPIPLRNHPVYDIDEV